MADMYDIFLSSNWNVEHEIIVYLQFVERERESKDFKQSFNVLKDKFWISQQIWFIFRETIWLWNEF